MKLARFIKCRYRGLIATLVLAGLCAPTLEIASFWITAPSELLVDASYRYLTHQPSTAEQRAELQQAKRELASKQKIVAQVEEIKPPVP